MTSRKAKLVSIVIPTLNEEHNVNLVYERLQILWQSMGEHYHWEIVFTDNHSSDNTFAILSELAAKDKRVRVLRFSRNFGYQRSILTGYLNSYGDAVIQLDCDLQDPPEMIPTLLDLWERGNQVVYGVRVSRGEGKCITLMRKLFYRVISQISEHDLPLDAGDFRLIDRRVVDELAKIDDRAPYLRGMIAAIGFRQIGVPYVRHARTHGDSKFRFRELMALAFDGIANHSLLPLRLANYCSAIVFVLALIVFCGYAAARIVVGNDWPAGFATIVILILLSTSLNAFFFGILGEYIARIHRQIRKEPLTIIESELNKQVRTDERPVRHLGLSSGHTTTEDLRRAM